ncbi:hypothetical protein E2C01_050057 [Portunus trituberculatus]|uniref:Uncharacterized protein n=1 Tax=Portunus trituberculatus TaxID=210409 RepID=A0A5B7GFG4_PORTR|nr:hypothetical protein [Portunus trituberculatus]
MVLLWMPDKHEAMDGTVTDEDKLAKRLGGGETTGNRWRSILIDIMDKEQRSSNLDNANRLKVSSEFYSKIYIKMKCTPA